MSRTPRTDFRALFPIGLPVKYQTEPPAFAGMGQTLIIGSDLVRFLCDRHLDVGQDIRLELAWPAPLPDGARLNLWMFGRVARCSLASEIEVRVAKYEFRTRRKARPATAASLDYYAGMAKAARTGS